jgi:hypothetical protein
MESDFKIIRLWLCVRIAAIGFILMALATVAFASPPDNRPPDNRPPDRPPMEVPDVTATARSDADARAAAVAIAGGGDGTASVEVGETTVNGGDNSLDASNSVVVDASGSPVSTTGGTVSNVSKNESNFFAFSTGFPQATGCFSGAQGGGGGDGGAGFLGFHWLDHNCWMSQLASAESDAEVRALLKCHSKKFRNAIAFNHPGKERQQWCVNYMTSKHMAEIEALKQQVEVAVETGTLGITDSPK